MKKYYIEETKCGITDGGMACGPVGGNVVVTIKFRDGNETKWLSLEEVGGIPNFFLFDKDVHEDLVKEDFDDVEFTSYMDEHSINKFDGIEFNGDYYDALNFFRENPENPVVPLIRYLIALVRCDMEEVEPLIKMAKGKYIDELDIPVSDIEEDYLADLEEEEE